MRKDLLVCVLGMQAEGQEAELVLAKVGSDLGQRVTFDLRGEEEVLDKVRVLMDFREQSRIFLQTRVARDHHLPCETIVMDAHNLDILDPRLRAFATSCRHHRLGGVIFFHEKSKAAIPPAIRMNCDWFVNTGGEFED